MYMQMLVITSVKRVLSVDVQAKDKRRVVCLEYMMTAWSWMF